MFKNTRFFSVLLCVLLIAALCGCTESEDTEVPVEENTEVSADIQETPEAEPIVDEPVPEPEPEEAEEPTEIEEEPVEEPVPEVETQPEQEVEEPAQEPEESAPVENKPVEQAPSSGSSSSGGSTTDPNSPNFDPYNRPGYVYIPGFGYTPIGDPPRMEDTGLDFNEILENSPQVGIIG